MVRWPLHPSPLDDESLSSWLTRLAAAYEMAPATFCHHVLALPPTSLDTLDVCPPAELVTMLADHTGWSRSRVEAMTLRRYEGILFETLALPTSQALSARLPGFHPDRRRGGTEGSDRHKGMQLTSWLLPRAPTATMPFCPVCLADGPVVYPRTAWSLALITVCRRHEVVLWDHCPACGEPLVRRWVNVAPLGWARCRCGVALALAPTMRAPAPVLWLTNRLQEALTTGTVVLNATAALPAHSYFAMVRTFVESVRLRWAHQPWAESCWHSLGIDPVAMRPQLAVPFEVQPLPWRLRILALVGQLLRPWPQAFVASCHRVALTGKTLLHRVQGLPATMLAPLEEVVGAQDPPMFTRFLLATGREAPGLGQDPRAWAHSYISACRRVGLATQAIRARSRALPPLLYDALDEVLFDERVDRAVARALVRAGLPWGQNRP